MKPTYDPDVLAVALRFMTTANIDLLTSGIYFVVEDDTGRLLRISGEILTALGRLFTPLACSCRAPEPTAPS